MLFSFIEPLFLIIYRDYEKTNSTTITTSIFNLFEGKGHTIIPLAPLVPQNDPTVLFTTAGMHPLVPYLLGENHPGGKRVVDVQKCIRTTDIDDVGITGI